MITHKRTAMIMVTAFLVLVMMTFGGIAPALNVAAVEAAGVGVYWDSGCSSVVSLIDWGSLYPGSSKTVTVYIRNEGDVAIRLSLDTTNWSPSNASNYMSLGWSYAGQTIDPNQVMQTTLTLLVSSSIEGITTFSFDIVITSEEVASPPPPPPPPSPRPQPRPDVTPPKISITVPEPHILIASTSVMVQWEGLDEESGIDHYSVYLNNESVINTTDVSCELSGLVEGFNNVTVTAYDKEGNFASDQIGIIVDLTPPSVEVTSPEDDYVTMATDVTVEWIGGDSVSGISHYRVYLDDVEVVNTTSTSLRLTALSEGSHVIRVEAYDLLNHTSSDKLSITIDNTPPIAEIRKPLEKAYVKGTYDVMIYGVDVNFHVMNLYVDEALIDAWNESGTHAYILDTTALDDGSHTIKLIIYDQAGNAGEDTITVIVDNTAPKVWINTPASREELTGIVNVRFAASDANLAEVRLYIDNETFDVSGETSYEWNTTSVNDGLHELKIVAIDEAGNTGENRITVRTTNAPKAETNVQKAAESTEELLFMIGMFSLSASVIGVIIILAILFIDYRLRIAGRRLL